MSFVNKYTSLENVVGHFFSDVSDFSLGVALGCLVRDVPIGSWSKRNIFMKEEYIAI